MKLFSVKFRTIWNVVFGICCPKIFHFFCQKVIAVSNMKLRKNFVMEKQFCVGVQFPDGGGGGGGGDRRDHYVAGTALRNHCAIVQL